MNVRVECYSGQKAEERPVRFQLGDRDYIVEELLDQWYGPDDAVDTTLASDGQVDYFRIARDSGTVHSLIR